MRALWVIIFSTMTCMITAQNSSILFINNTLHSNIPTKDISIWLDNHIQKYVQQGYNEASVDTFYVRKDTTFASIRYGTKKPIVYAKKIIDYKQLTHIVDSTYLGYKKQGYAFVVVNSALTCRTDTLYASIMVKKDAIIRLGDIHLPKESKLSSRFLGKFIQWKKGGIYTTSTISQHKKYITLLEGWEWNPASYYIIEDSTAYLETSPLLVPSSTASGIVGIMPKPSRDGYLLTGEADISLQNILYRNEKINIVWKSLGGSSQYLKVQLQFPYLLAAKYGMEGYVSIFKRDSTQFQTQQKLFLTYTAPSIVYKIGIEKQSNQQLSTPKSSTKFNGYTLSFQYKSANYQQYKSRYYGFVLSTTIGNRSNSNNTVDSSKLQQLRYIQATVHLPFLGKWAWQMSSQSQAIVTKNNLYTSELLRIGGANSLRGFYEESIIAKAYTLFISEIKYYITPQTQLFQFTNIAYYQHKTNLNTYYDLPIGTGLGIALENKNLINTISWAVGKERNNGFSFSNSKIHISSKIKF